MIDNPAHIASGNIVDETDVDAGTTGDNSWGPNYVDQQPARGQSGFWPAHYVGGNVNTGASDVYMVPIAEKRT